LCNELLSYVYFCYLIVRSRTKAMEFSLVLCVLIYCVCIAVLHTVVARVLARSQYPEGPATGHLGTGLSWFRCV
jgi:hypothetical protein